MERVDNVGVGGVGVGGGWMNRVGEVMGGLSKQLPSIHKAVTTMSFLAFGVFITNLLVQALANVRIENINRVLKFIYRFSSQFFFLTLADNFVCI